MVKNKPTAFNRCSNKTEITLRNSQFMTHTMKIKVFSSRDIVQNMEILLLTMLSDTCGKSFVQKVKNPKRKKIALMSPVVWQTTGAECCWCCEEPICRQKMPRCHNCNCRHTVLSRLQTASFPKAAFMEWIYAMPGMVTIPSLWTMHRRDLYIYFPAEFERLERNKCSIGAEVNLRECWKFCIFLTQYKKGFFVVWPESSIYFKKSI